MKATSGVTTLNRRRFTSRFAAATALSVTGFPALSFASGPRVVTVGAGAGGASVARQLAAKLGDQIELVVVSGPAPDYKAPFLGKALLLGDAGPSLPGFEVLFRDLSLTLVGGTAVAIDRSAKTLKVQRDSESIDLAYDILVVAPGVALKNSAGGQSAFDDPKGACWTAGGNCNAMMAGVDALPKGGMLTVIAPPQPYRCPPAIYERVCLLAHRLKLGNPDAKILILDEKDRYPMQALFETAYADYYEDMIEWVPLEFHGGVTSIDYDSGVVITDFEEFQADFIHALPAQVAPAFLTAAGLGDEKGYCPIDAASMRSSQDPDVYVVGDAAAAGEMSKSASSAVVQGQLAAGAIAARVKGQSFEAPEELTDQCWSFVAPDDAVKLGGRYRPAGDHFAAIEHFTSDIEDSAEIRRANAQQARAWPSKILTKIYGIDL